MENLISRKDALAVGLPRFFTGKPCKHGHISERYTTTGGCIACLRQTASQYRQTAGRRRIPTVRVMAAVHPDDAEKIYQIMDYLNKCRGLLPVPRPVASGGTAWELYVRAECRRFPVPTGRPSLEEMRRVARLRGIVPDQYTPGVQPFEEWAVPIRPPNFAGVVVDRDNDRE